ncbi:MAG TPA: acyl-CoA dehydrogenase family protein [Eoetvoesiella sp.]
MSTPSENSTSIEPLDAFRKEVQDFIRQVLPAELSARVERGYAFLTKDDYTFWQKQLYARGWGAPTWPREFGGADWSAEQNQIFEEECARNYCPRTQPQGVKMIGPILYTYGTPKQRHRFLSQILSGDEWWCQGYSEPGAGSDLASLSTRAVREGGHYRVSGQKVWTTHAHWADWMFCLTRTENTGKPQEGITFLLIDMRSEGVSVKPIITIDSAHHTNEVFLDDVMVPVENRIGDEGSGWKYTKALLAKERVGIAELGRARERLERLKRLANDGAVNGNLLSSDVMFQGYIAELEIEILAAEATTLRVMQDRDNSEPALSSLLKLRGSEIGQRITSLLVDALGPHALRNDLELAVNQPAVDDPLPSYAIGRLPEYLRMRAQTIAGGTSEVQRNVMAKLLFGKK